MLANNVTFLSIIVLLLGVIAWLLYGRLIKPAAGSVREPAAPALDPAAVPCAASADGSWSGSQGSSASVTLSRVPAGITPYQYTFNETSLLAQTCDHSITAPISVAADIRFFEKVNGENVLKTRFDHPLKFTMIFNDNDRLKLAAYNQLHNSILHTSDLIPVLIEPDKSNTWKRFPDGTVEYIPDGVIITIHQWGDPPAGWGVARGG